VAYTNGQIPDAALVSITGMAGARLRPGPAAAWEVLRRAVFAAYGWYPTPTGISDAYRSYAVQESIFRARYTTSYLAGRPTKRWQGRTWYLLPGKATAATPGTAYRGLVITVDITGLGGFTGTRYLQLAAVAVPLGWSNTEGRSIGEAWHWNYTGPVEDTSNPGDSTGTVPDGPNTNPIAPPEEVDLDATQAKQLAESHTMLSNLQAAFGGMQASQADTSDSVLKLRRELARIGTRSYPRVRG